MRPEDNPRSPAEARALVARRYGSWPPGVAVDRVVTDKAEVRLPTLGTRGFGQRLVRLSPGQTVYVETTGGRIVEIHRLGTDVTWRRAK